MRLVRPEVAAAAAALCLAAAFASEAAEDDLRLEWKFPPGARRAWLATLANEQTFTALGMKTTSESTETATDEVAAGEGGAPAVLWRLQRVTLKANLGPGGELDYDSAKPEDAEKASHKALEGVVPLLGRAVRYEVGGSGKVGNVAPVGEAAGLKADSIARRLQGYYLDLPERPLHAGETWSVRMPVPFETFRGGVRERVYSFTGVSERAGRKVARIAVADTFVFEPPTPVEGEEEPLMKLAGMKGTGTGEIWFLVDEGCVLEETFEAKMSLTVSMGMMDTELDVVERSNRKRTD